MDIVERLQIILKYSCLPVRALAIKCSLKQQTLDKHIKGISEPSANTLIGIAKAFLKFPLTGFFSELDLCLKLTRNRNALIVL